MKKDLPEFCVHNSMIYFLYGFEKRRYGYGTLQEILRELSPLPKGGTSNPAVWEEWKRCINESLKEIFDIKTFDEMTYKKYTKLQAFDAMVDFFINYYKRTSDGNLRTLMEVILDLSEDSTDQAGWNNWNNATKKALQKQDRAKSTDDIEKKLTELQAFNAMVKFLDEYYEETSADFVDLIRSAMSFLPDGDTADPVFWEDWNIAIKKILHEQNNKKHVDKILGISVTESQAFKTMIKFLKNYYKRGPDPDIKTFFNYLHLLPDGNSASPAIREKWSRCVDSALKERPGTREYLILGEK